MRSDKFLLSSEECELLLAFEHCMSIEKAADHLSKDPSGVSRSLARIAGKYPALEKRAGKWTLTELGKRLNRLTKDSIQMQRSIASHQTSLRIGTNREFGARIVGPKFQDLRDLFPNTQLFVYTFAYGTESAILNGKIDIGVDCERPHDPEVAFKLLIEESISAVASPDFFKTYKSQIQDGLMHLIPHLLCYRLYPSRILLTQDNNQIL